MKKIITLIGIGAALCFAPSCRKSTITPQKFEAVDNIQERVPSQPQTPANENTSLYVMLKSAACATPQKEYTSMMLNIKDVRVFNPATGWQDLKAVSNGWDMLFAEQGTTPGFNITELMAVNAGKITKAAITFGDNNKLVVNNKIASCFSLASREVVVDFGGEVKAGRVNRLVLDLDACGHIGMQTNADGAQCYVLKPVVYFDRLSQDMVK